MSREEYQKQLNWRLKQVEIGQKAPSYQAYKSTVLKHQRERHHPSTPDPFDARMSKRQFEGRVKAWKRAVHELFPSRPKNPVPKQRITLFLNAAEAQSFSIEPSVFLHLVTPNSQINDSPGMRHYKVDKCSHNH